MLSNTFIAEGKLKRLVKLLRMLGLSCEYDGGESLQHAMQRAILKDSILLTLKPILPTRRLRVIQLPESSHFNQFEKISNLIPITEFYNPFSRCLICNSILRGIKEDNSIKFNIPESVSERGLQLFHCNTCEKVYWEGSHIQKMLSRLIKARILDKKANILYENQVDS